MVTQIHCAIVGDRVYSVQFPSTAQERHCSRKRARTTSRGVSEDKPRDYAINTLGTTINKITDSSDNFKPKSKRLRVKRCTTKTKQTEIVNFEGDLSPHI